MIPALRYTSERLGGPPSGMHWWLSVSWRLLGGARGYVQETQEGAGFRVADTNDLKNHDTRLPSCITDAHNHDIPSSSIP